MHDLGVSPGPSLPGQLREPEVAATLEEAPMILVRVAPAGNPSIECGGMDDGRHPVQHHASPCSAKH